MTQLSESQQRARDTYLFAARASAVVIAVVAVVAGVVGWMVARADGVWTALAGASVATVFGLVTTLAAWRGTKGDPATFIAWVMGTWLIKILVVVALVIVFGNQSWLVRPLFGVALVVGVLAALAVDIIALTRSRVPYVDPRPASGGDGVG